MPFIDVFRTLRERAGLRISRVAREAQLSEDTIQRIERHHGVSRVSCIAAIEALNRLYYNNKVQLDHGEYITEASRFGGHLSPDASQLAGNQP